MMNNKAGSSLISGFYSFKVVTIAKYHSEMSSILGSKVATNNGQWLYRFSKEQSNGRSSKVEAAKYKARLRGKLATCPIFWWSTVRVGMRKIHSEVGQP